MKNKTASPEIDWEKMLAPISEDQPAGEFLIYERVYDEIKLARREDDATLDQGIWATDLKRAQWDQVESICLDALMFRSKDLQIAAWLLESWIHLYGFEGVRVGLELLLRLSREFWEKVFPLKEGDDLEARIAPFDWLDEKLSIKLKLAPVLKEGRDGISYRYSDWELASRNENQIRKGSLKVQEGDESHLTQNLFLTNCKWAPQGFFPGEREVLEGALENLEALGQFLDEKCGKHSPSLRHFGDTLKSILRLVADIIKYRGETVLTISTQKVEEDAPMEDEDKAEKNTQEVVKKTYQGNISSREEAYQILQEVAQYLEAIEPHSPTPYLIRRAAIWGGMSFAQLLAELVRDPNDLRIIHDFLGLKPSSETEDYEQME